MIIAVAGKAGSGKDTVGKIIQLLTADNELRDKNPEDVLRQYEYCEKNKLWDTLVINNSTDWRIKKFAGKLKQIVSILTGIPVEDLEKQEVKDSVLGEEWNKSYPLGRETILQEHKYWEDRPMTVRQLLQEIGTDAMRNIIHPDIWVNALFNEYIPKETGRKGSLFYPYWIITDLRFLNELQRVKEYKGITIKVTRDNLPNNSSNHYSEIALDYVKNWDYTIDNSTNSIEDLIEKVREVLINEKIM